MKIHEIIKILKNRKERITGNNKITSFIGVFSILSFIGFIGAVTTASNKTNIINEMSAEIKKLTEDMEYYQKNSYEYQSKFVEYQSKYYSLLKENNPVQDAEEESKTEETQESSSQMVNTKPDESIKEESSSSTTKKDLTYDDIASNPATYKGKGINLTGIVKQTYEEGYDLVIRLQMTDNVNSVLIARMDIDEASGFKTGDTVEISGVFLGNQNYNSLSGNRSVPHAFLKSIKKI